MPILEYDEYVEAHRKLVLEYGVRDGQDVINMATSLAIKLRISFPDAVQLLAAIGMHWAKTERSGRRITKA